VLLYLNVFLLLIQMAQANATTKPKDCVSELEFAIRDLSQALAPYRSAELALKETEGLKPLFQSKFVHEAIYKEMKARGHKSAGDISSVIKQFKNLSEDEQNALIDGVVHRVVAGIDIGSRSKTKSILKLDDAGYATFKNFWEEAAEGDFNQLRAALLIELEGGKKEFIADINGSGSWFKRVSRLLSPIKTKGVIVAKPSRYQPTSLRSNLKSYYENSQLFAYINGAPEKLAKVFVENHYKDMSLNQLVHIFEAKDIKDLGLSQSMREKIGIHISKLKKIEAAYESYDSLQAVWGPDVGLANARSRFGQRLPEIEKNLSALTKIPRALPSIQEALLDLSKIAQKHGAAPDFAAMSVLNDYFKENISEMSAVQFVDLIKAAIDMFAHFSLTPYRNEAEINAIVGLVEKFKKLLPDYTEVHMKNLNEAIDRAYQSLGSTYTDEIHRAGGHHYDLKPVPKSNFITEAEKLREEKKIMDAYVFDLLGKKNKEIEDAAKHVKKLEKELNE